MTPETGTMPENMNASDADYLDLNGIRMHVDAIDGIARDVAEGLPSEVGGLLLGVIEKNGERNTVRVERYQRIPCEHSFGPGFVLDPKDRTALEAAAGAAFEAGRMEGIGFYRS